MNTSTSASKKKRVETVMKKFKEIFRVNQVVRLNNSYYGNPRYLIYIETMHDGKLIRATTTPNINCAYMISSYMEGKEYEFIYHLTPSKEIRIDNFLNLERSRYETH